MTKLVSEDRRRDIIYDAKFCFNQDRKNGYIHYFYDEKGLQYDRIITTYRLKNRSEAKIWVQAYIGLID